MDAQPFALETELFQGREGYAPVVAVLLTSAEASRPAA